MFMYRMVLKCLAPRGNSKTNKHIYKQTKANHHQSIVSHFRHSFHRSSFISGSKPPKTIKRGRWETNAGSRTNEACTQQAVLSAPPSCFQLSAACGLWGCCWRRRPGTPGVFGDTSALVIAESSFLIFRGWRFHCHIFL